MQQRQVVGHALRWTDTDPRRRAAFAIVAVLFLPTSSDVVDSSSPSKPWLGGSNDVWLCGRTHRRYGIEDHDCYTLPLG